MCPSGVTCISVSYHSKNSTKSVVRGSIDCVSFYDISMRVFDFRNCSGSFILGTVPAV